MFRLCFHTVIFKGDFWTLPWILSEIVCLTAVFVACSLFCTYSDFGNTCEQATRTPFYTNYFNWKQGLEQTNILKERVFMMFICSRESNGFSFQKIAAFRVVRPKAKSNSNNVFGHGTA